MKKFSHAKVLSTVSLFLLPFMASLSSVGAMEKSVGDLAYSYRQACLEQGIVLPNIKEFPLTEINFTEPPKFADLEEMFFGKNFHDLNSQTQQATREYINILFNQKLMNLRNKGRLGFAEIAFAYLNVTYSDNFCIYTPEFHGLFQSVSRSLDSNDAGRFFDFSIAIGQQKFAGTALPIPTELKDLLASKLQKEYDSELLEQISKMQTTPRNFPLQEERQDRSQQNTRPKTPDIKTVISELRLGLSETAQEKVDAYLENFSQEMKDAVARAASVEMSFKEEEDLLSQKKLLIESLGFEDHEDYLDPIINSLAISEINKIDELDLTYQKFIVKVIYGLTEEERKKLKKESSSVLAGAFLGTLSEPEKGL